MALRLALYSDQEIPANRTVDEAMLGLLGVRRPKIGYFASSPDPQRRFFERKRAYYAALGARLECYVDAETASNEDSVAAALHCDAIHLSGDNTYAFLRWLRERHLVEALRNYAREQGVLIGTSAGAILMIPDIRTANLCGDAPDPSLSDPRGLDLTSFLFLPHFSQAAAAPPAWKPPVQPGRSLYACPDGCGVIVAGEAIETCGPVSIFRADAHRLNPSSLATPDHALQRTEAGR